ncbi:MAG: ATP-binding protein [Bacteroidota bacterium]
MTQKNKGVIVCVDDERMVLESLKMQLLRSFPDFEVEIAEDGNEALELIDELVSEGYDVPVVISDHIMPQLPGDKLLISIHQKYPEILKILLTGLADADAVGNAINHGGLYRYISKPWDETDLSLTIKEGLNAYYKNQTLEQQNDELKALITELELKNAELEQFTYTVSHDLKSPLITIKGFVSYLEEDLVSRDQARISEDMEHIKLAAEKMNNLLDDLLELSRVGKVKKEPEECVFDDLVKEATANLRGSIKSRGVKIKVQPDLGNLRCEKFRMVELLQNLLENAIKFSGDKPLPEITIGSKPENGHSIYYVKDNGIGIDSKFHSKIFGLFERLETNTEGTGIGLAISKKIVQSQGGEIWVESEGKDKGSTFYFTLDSIE